MSRDTYWVYADVSCAAYSLSDIDTINDDGKMNDLSALYLIVNGVILGKWGKFTSFITCINIKIKKKKETEEHVKMIDGYLYDLLTKKWNHYVKFRQI
jgi:transient receptor potential cation channel subfamily V member 5